MAAQTTRTTAAELLIRPRGLDRCELIEGELHTMEPAGANLGRVAMEVGALINAHAKRHGGAAFAAETGFLLATGPDTVRAPDAAYVTAAHAERVGEPAGYWPGPPDLAAEVVSPGDTYPAVQGKALQWLAAGVRVVLIVDPANQTVTRMRSPHDVTVHAAAEPVDCSPAMPGFAPAARELLAA